MHSQHLRMSHCTLLTEGRGLFVPQCSVCSCLETTDIAAKSPRHTRRMENAPLGPYTIKLRQLCVKYGLFDSPVSVARLSGTECLEMIKALVRDLQLQLPYANRTLAKLKVSQYAYSVLCM